VAPAGSASPVASAAPAPAPALVDDDGAWIRALLDRLPGRFDRRLADAAERRLELLVSEPEGPAGAERLASHGLRVGREYVYPASAIKPFVAAAALRKLELLSAAEGQELDVDTPIRWCTSHGPPCAIGRDASNLAGGTLTVGHELRKMLLVSDNAAFGRLYDFVGHRELAELMARWGFASVRLRHRMGGSEQEGLTSPAYELAPPGGSPLAVPARRSELVLAPNLGPALLVGRAHRDEDGKLQRTPRDFGDRNAASVAELQRLLVGLVRPELLGGPPLELSDAHRSLLCALMQAVPRESRNPRYAGERYDEARFRPLLAGLVRRIPRAELDYLNKSGKAYGFVVENAFLRHRPSGRSLFVTVALYADDDGVANDDSYAYDRVSEPFLRDLGEALALELLDAQPHDLAH
jgi:hypothetical protein